MKCEARHEAIHAKLLDDFVPVNERLRYLADVLDAEVGPDSCQVVSGLCRDAADLIERLARELSTDEA